MKLNGKDTFLLFLKGKSFEHKGDFDATAIYQNTNQIIDCVLYNGTSYYCKKTTTAGIMPTNTEYWGVLASSSIDANIIDFIENEKQKSEGEDGAILHEGDINAGNGIEIANGVISVSNIKELWANPNPTSNFSSQTVTLNSSDYDFLIIIWNEHFSDAEYDNGVIVKKGKNIALNSIVASGYSPYIYLQNRYVIRNSDISYTFKDCLEATPSGRSTNNARIIPRYIYGLKGV